MDNKAYEIMDNIEEIHWWYTGRREILRKVLNKFITKKPKILDIGCGTGGNFSLLRKYGTIRGIEYSELAIKKARKKFPNIDIKKGSLPNDFPIKNERYDLITMFDVLEHINDDQKSLEIVYNYLNNNGRLVITVPAFNFLWSKSDEVQFHKRRYTKKQLLEILKKNNYQIEFSSYFNFFLFFPVYFGKFLIRCDKNYTTNKEMEIKSKLLNKLLYIIFKCESYFLPNIKFPFGVSIIIVAKRIL